MSKTTYDLEKAIKSARVKLIMKAESRGIYEDFGVIEARKIRDEFEIGFCANHDEGVRSDMISEFEEWAMNYDG